MNRRRFVATAATATTLTTGGCTLGESSETACERRGGTTDLNAGSDRDRVPDTAGYWPTPQGPINGTRSVPGGDRYTGTVHRAWSRETDSRADGPRPVLSDGKLYFADDAQRLVALDPTDGRVDWRDETVTVDHSVVAGPELLYLRSGTTVVAFDPDRRRVVWTFDPETDDTALPVPRPDSDRVFVRADDPDTLYALGEEGEPVWTAPATGPPAITDDRVFVPDGSQLRAIGRVTGEREWTREVETGVVTSLAVRNGRVFLTGSDVTAFDAETGTREWSHTPAGGRTERPAVAPRRLYVPTSPFQWYGRRLYAYDHAGTEPLECGQLSSFTTGGQLVVTDDLVVNTGGIETSDGTQTTFLQAGRPSGNVEWRITRQSQTELKALCAGRRALFLADGFELSAFVFE